jgi:hypothetical protein
MSKHPLYNLSGLQKNNKSHVLYALTNKQIELKLIQDDYEAKISKIRVELLALETTICLFDRDCSKTIEKLNTKAKRVQSERNRYFEKGVAKKVVLNIFKSSNTELMTEEITKKAIVLQGLEKDNQNVLINVGKTVLNILRALERDNIIINSSKSGRMLLWKIRD